MPNGQRSLFEEVQELEQHQSDAQVLVRIAERLLSEAEAEPPVPVERIASLRGVVRIEEREQPWAGTLEPRGGALVLTVRASDGYERQRFTVCHETSHTAFPGFTQHRQFRCKGQRTILEQRCDALATELLLPRRFFEEDLRRGDFGLELVEELASSYEASVEATALRLTDLWPEPAALLVLRARHKPSERGQEAHCDPKLRLDYSVSRGDWPYFLRHKSAESDSPLLRAMDGERVSETASLAELALSDPGTVELHARRYGREGRVIALARRTQQSRKEVVSAKTPQ